MPILHVRNVPEETYRRLQRVAEQHNRSLSAEVVQLLESALSDEERRVSQLELLERARQLRYTFPTEQHVPEAWELIREDRDR